MKLFRRTPLLPAAFAVLFLVACSEQDETQREADAMAERTEKAIEQDPATDAGTPAEPQEPASIPAPDNVSAPPADAQKTQNGIAYVALEDAPGETHPAPTDTVTVHYTGWTTDGKMFDSSLVRGEPATFPLDALIPGWQEGVPLMTVGDKYRFWIPGELAYDNSNRPGAPKGMLVFDIELLDVQNADGGQAQGGESS